LNFETLPENSFWMISIPSASFSSRVGASGQYSPVMCSFSASPAPRPSQKRPGIHLLQGRGGLGDDRRVVARAGRRHAGAEAQLGRRAERAEPGPDEAALPLTRRPGVEVIGGHDRPEADLLRDLTVAQQIARRELLEHRGVAHRDHCVPPSEKS
jgi:hypothetical protein